MFITDIVNRFGTEVGQPLKINDSRNISRYLWKDNLVLMSISGEGHGNMLSALLCYVKESRMTINTKKPSVIKLVNT